MQSAKSTGKLQLSLVIFGLLFLSGQEPAKAIHPVMNSFDNPAMGFEVRVFTGI